MQQKSTIILPINDTQYQFEIKTNQDHSSPCHVSISFLSMERNWVLIFKDEEMMFSLGLWYFKRRELPKAILEKELIISQYIATQIETV